MNPQSGLVFFPAGAGRTSGIGGANFKLIAIEHELPDFLKRDVARNLGVVETAIRIFLDNACLCHAANLAGSAALHQYFAGRLLRSKSACERHNKPSRPVGGSEVFITFCGSAAP